MTPRFGQRQYAAEPEPKSESKDKPRHESETGNLGLSDSGDEKAEKPYLNNLNSKASCEDDNDKNPLDVNQTENCANDQKPLSYKEPNKTVTSTQPTSEPISEITP